MIVAKSIESISEVRPKGRRQWRLWLKKNHGTENGVWLVLAKKASGLPSLPLSEAVEEALCFAWIDSVANTVDEDYFKIFIARRNPKSKWSKINKGRVTKLIRLKLMTPAGLSVIKKAKKSGHWTALDEIEKLVLPADLKKAFFSNKKARENFEEFPASVKKGILHWIISAKKPETRSKRIHDTVSMAEKNIRANQWIKKLKR
jgi:uncharacterized protein YdeI (YjbR/CyaY-like superfamily)